MIFPKLEMLVAAAPRFLVFDPVTKTLMPFRLNGEQLRVLALILENQSRVCVGKGRQVGISTAVAFLLMWLVLLNPGISVCIIANDQSNANGVLKKVKGWLRQMGAPMPPVDNVESLELANGSSIVAKTAISHAEQGQSKAGRSNTYSVIHATEQSFWRNELTTWTSLTSTMLGGLIVNESTGAPGKGEAETNLFRSIYEGADDGWARAFIGVEEHAAYVDDEMLVDDARWAELQALYGFTSRPHAAWWDGKLATDFKGNASAMLREFPVTPDHMFTFREGVHVQTWTEVPVIVDGDWNYYEMPTLGADNINRWGEPAIMGVDTGAGLGGDSSTVAFIGHRTGRVLATWRNNTSAIPSFIQHLHATIKRYAPLAFVVESNGVGQSVWSSLAGYPGGNEQRSGDKDGEVAKRREELRQAIESGKLLVGGHLLEEVQSATIKAKRGLDGRTRIVFEGHDDVINAVSFARKWRDENPWKDKPAEREKGHFYVSERLRGVKRQMW